jgi:hypothetical protein
MNEEITGKPPQLEDVFWKTTILEMAKESISSIEESAKHLIAAASFLEGVYFHAIYVADLKLMSGSLAYYDVKGLLVFLFSLPFLLWFMVIGCATMALMTKAYTVHPDEAEDAKRVIEKMANTKHRWLMRGLYILMASFVVLFVDIYLFLGAR